MEMTSVTQVLDWITEPELLAWFKRVGWKKAEQIGEEARMIGTAVDLTIQLQLRSALPCTSPLPSISKLPSHLLPQFDSCMAGWRQFCKENAGLIRGVTEVQTELTDGEVVGHPDVIIEYEYAWEIMDVKAANAIRSSHWTQVAKYSDLYLYDKTKDTKRIISILRLDKHGGNYEYKLLDVDDIIQYEVSVFDAYKLIYEHGTIVRERERLALEKEILNVP